MAYGVTFSGVRRPTSSNPASRITNICTGLQHIHYNEASSPAFRYAAAY